jgi:hypothetical protein
MTKSDNYSWPVISTGSHKLWNENLYGDNVKIALIDTGVNIHHPDFCDQPWYCSPDQGSSKKAKIEAYNFVEESLDIKDKYGHGSFVASQIAGNGKSGVYTGVAPRSTIIPLVVDNDSQEFLSAIDYAITLKVDLINISKSLKIGIENSKEIWFYLCLKALKNNIIICCSVGNQGQLKKYPPPFNIGYPACLPSISHEVLPTAIFSVGVSNKQNKVHQASGTGPCNFILEHDKSLSLIKPDICSPGAGSTACNNLYPHRTSTPYCDFMGSSSATAYTTGSIALLIESCKRSGKPVIATRLITAILKTVVPFENQKELPEQKLGAGHLDIFSAWEYGKNKDWWE